LFFPNLKITGWIEFFYVLHHLAVQVFAFSEEGEVEMIKRA
jgi:hypothetical protein